MKKFINVDCFDFDPIDRNKLNVILSTIDSKKFDNTFRSGHQNLGVVVPNKTYDDLIDRLRLLTKSKSNSKIKFDLDSRFADYRLVEIFSVYCKKIFNHSKSKLIIRNLFFFF